VSVDWNNGRVEITIEQRHIDRAIERHSHAAAAEAIKEQTGWKFVSVDIQTIRGSDPRKGLRFCFLTPHVVQHSIILPFDAGERENCKPITFTMKPAFVTKSGKKRAHTPSNDELADVNLRVARKQPHLPPSANRASWQERNRAASAVIVNGGPEPPKPRRKPRVARAKVSAASKGSVPTTLGGKLPPQILSRREWGLRALRR
jgi:hypothetical protein